MYVVVSEQNLESSRWKVHMWICEAASTYRTDGSSTRDCDRYTAAPACTITQSGQALYCFCSTSNLHPNIRKTGNRSFQVLQIWHEKGSMATQNYKLIVNGIWTMMPAGLRTEHSTIGCISDTGQKSCANNDATVWGFNQ